VLIWDSIGYLLVHISNLFLQDIINLEKTEDVHPDDIDSIYSRLVNILRVCSDTAVPVCQKNFLNTGGTRKWTN